MLNRAGESTFWASNNENFINYARGFSEGFFFQEYFAYLLSNKAYNFLYIAFFNKCLSKIKSKSIQVEQELRNVILTRLHYRNNLKHTGKAIKKTFWFCNYFFAKVFFFSFYKLIIVTVKIYTRLHLSAWNNTKHKNNMYKFFWKLGLCNYYTRTFAKSRYLSKAF